MAYNTKYLLTDATGKNNIPQYYDPASDSYKPLTIPKVKDSFSSTSNITKTYSTSMNGFAIQNDGDTDITFTINGLTIIVKPTEGFEDTFEPFTQIQISATGSYRVIVRG